VSYWQGTFVYNISRMNFVKDCIKMPTSHEILGHRLTARHVNFL